MKLKKYLIIMFMFAFILSLTLLVSCQKNIKQDEEKDDNPKQTTESTYSQTTVTKTETKEVTTTEQTATEESAEEAVDVPTFINLVDGKNFSFADMKDYVLIVDFWAPWCPPCRAEVPGFIELQKTYKDKKFAVIGVAVSTTEEAVKDFIKEQKVNYPMIMGTDDLVMEYETKMDKPITAIPTTFVINRKGEVAKVHVGAVEKSVFEQEIQKLF